MRQHISLQFWQKDFFAKDKFRLAELANKQKHGKDPGGEVWGTGWEWAQEEKRCRGGREKMQG